MPSPEYILNLAQQIVEVKKHLAELEEEWDGYFPANPTKLKPKPLRKGGKKPDPNSVQGRVLKHLSENSSLRINATTVSHSLGIDLKQAERALFKLYAANKILRPARGMFQGKAHQEVAAA